jgi:DNA (cytosine-5)-methyltransferase 1
MTSRERYKFVDLFAGIGGTRIAFERAGATCVFTSEWDKHCQATYRHFFGDHALYGDITDDTTKKAIPAFDILVAGFPCQPFSSIGKREGFEHPTQGTLFHDILDILRRRRPSAFLLENVKGLTHHDGGKTLRVIRESLDQITPKLGYWVNYKVLNAAEYGVPQQRERIYIVGFRKDLVDATNPIEAGAKIGFSFAAIPKEAPRYINAYLDRGVTDRSISEHLQKVYIHKLDDGRPQILDRKGRQIANTLTSSYHKIQRLTGIFVKDGPTGLRLLSEGECRAIMGFPAIDQAVDGRTYPAVPVSRTQMYRQFGNSVAVPVVQKVAEGIVQSLKRIGVQPNG